VLLFQHSLVEQFLYSACQRYILSHTSGFVRMALLLGMRTTSAFVLPLDEEGRANQQCVDDKTASSVDWLARTSSGI
jgi:hypothetical protein